MWNKNIDDAPRDGFIWAASKCEKVIKSNWIESRQSWSGFTASSPPIAWQAYHKPTHPNLEGGA